MSDTLTIRFGVQIQPNAAVYSTPNSISPGDISFISPALSQISSATVTATTAGTVPSFSMFRLNFDSTNYSFPFPLCGSGNVIVQFDDPAIQTLTPTTIVVLQDTAHTNTMIAASAGNSQTPIMVRSELGAFFGSTVTTWQLSTANAINFISGVYTAPNVNFSCTVYCY